MITRIFALFFGAAVAAHSTLAAGTCDPAFSYSQGWRGADGASSVEISPGKSLWFFGDTFISPKDSQRTRVDLPMIRNSLGISECGSLNYFWGNSSSRTHPRSSFDTKEAEKDWFWPSDAVFYQGKVYVALLHIEITDEPTLFNFKVSGMSWSIITPGPGNPNSWNIETKALASLPLGLDLGSSMAIDGQHLLFYTLREAEQGKQPFGAVVLMRTPLANIDSPDGHFEYLAQNGKWKPGPAGADAKEVMSAGQNEFTVRYHPELKKWISVMTEPGLFSPRILSMSAPAPEGPWSEPHVVYTIPEMTPGSEKYVPGTFCYAAKEHTELARDRSELAITYNCNNTIEAILSNMDLYRPQLIRVPTP